MALSANALTTLATLKEDLGATVPSDSILERAINAASDAIERYCDRKFYREVIAAELVCGYGTQKLLLSRRPLVSIQTVAIEGVTVDASEYYISDAEAGVLFRRSGWDWTAQLQPGAPEPREVAGTEEPAYSVAYTGGYVLPQTGGGRNLPFDLEQACIISAVALVRAKGKYVKLVQMTADGDQRPWYDYVLPPNCRALLTPYKRVV